MIKPVLQDDTFLADVLEPLASPEETRLWWLGQSGFLIKCRDGCVLLDPYLSDSLTDKYACSDTPHVRVSERVVDPTQLNFIDVVTASHGHTDHLDPQTLRQLNSANPRMIMIAPRSIRGLADERLGRHVDIALDAREGWCLAGGRTSVLALPASHPELSRDANGRHLHLGYEILAYRASIYHSGDTVPFDGIELELTSPPDLAILPINGKLGNMNGVDAAKFAKRIGAKLVIPCHYDMFEFNTADPYEQFVPECERLGQPYRVLKLGERFTLKR